MVDKNGLFTYSHVIAFSIANSGNQLSIYPNPIKGNTCTIIADFDISKPLNYTLYNSDGKTIQKGILSSQQQIIDISALSKGIYLIQRSNGEKTTVVKM